MTAKKIGFAVTSLTKSEIIGKLTGHPKLSRVLATEIMELLVRIIRHHMENGGTRVLISGLGTFTASKRKSYVTTHPQDPTKKIKIPNMKRITFRACDDFLAAVNRK
jgi:nucleoid DNA-binding protein